MTKLDPGKLFQRLAKDIPKELHKHLVVTGSLAAAYHFQTRLEGRAINTKDADLVVHPAGNITSCKVMAHHLISLGWHKTEQCHPQQLKKPVRTLRAIRLYPPKANDYFIEFLNLPKRGQLTPKQWFPIKLDDGWYGLPSFRFMGLVAYHRLKSKVGIDYAAPAMMALSNLLSHQHLGKDRIESGLMRGTLRSAKDLGRVLALAYLSGREETERWLPLWMNGLKKCFPRTYRSFSQRVGQGLRELLVDQAALAEARQTTEIGLLNRMGITAEILRATGERLLVDVIDPLKTHFDKV